MSDPHTPLRIATRTSDLARTQSDFVANTLKKAHPNLKTSIVPIQSKGDLILDRPLAQVGGKGLFVKALEEALLDNRADIAVHSLKDVPGDAELAPGLVLASFVQRAAAHDMLITAQGHSLGQLQAGARVGTSSPRRRCQLLSERPDLRVDTLRGNLGTRLQTLRDGKLDAIVLAAAGLQRLPSILGALQAHPLPLDRFVPSAGQGTLVIQARQNDAQLCTQLKATQDHGFHLCALAERECVKHLNGSCHSSIGAYARLDTSAQQLTLDAMVGTEDGRTCIHAGSQRLLPSTHPTAQQDQARALGLEVATTLIKQGAFKLLNDASVRQAQRALIADRQRRAPIFFAGTRPHTKAISPTDSDDADPKLKNPKLKN